MDTISLQDLAGQYVGFVLDEEEYGLSILSVHEIIRYQELTRVPETPPFVEGVLNLRGKVIPVINLRKKFEMEERESNSSTRIIVVDLDGRTMGMIVDEVREVQMVEADSISEAPAMGTGLSTEYILGMAKVGDGLRILLDINRVLSDKEKQSVDEAANA